MSLTPEQVAELLAENTDTCHRRLMERQPTRAMTLANGNTVQVFVHDLDLKEIEQRAANLAADKTRKQVGEAAWRRYRSWRTALSSPSVLNGEGRLVRMHRNADIRSGSHVQVVALDGAAVDLTPSDDR
jgi:hypothetical protein